MPLILKSLAGGVAVITGGASGLGYAMAEEARQYGMHVVLTDIRKGPLDDAISRLKKSVTSIDLSPHSPSPSHARALSLSLHAPPPSHLHTSVGRYRGPPRPTTQALLPKT
jgi:NAD(P)-dependent dehydrogenase (short-subunit alcohol dehydrogenase family)